MNENEFNMQVRKFLKEVGVTSQREIEKAVRAALEDGRLAPNGSVKASVLLKIEGLDVEHSIEHDIRLS